VRFLQRLSALAHQGTPLQALCTHIEQELPVRFSRYRGVVCTSLDSAEGEPLRRRWLEALDARGQEAVLGGVLCTVEEAAQDAASDPSRRGSGARVLVPGCWQGRAVVLLDVLTSEVGPVGPLEIELLEGAAGCLALVWARQYAAPSWGESTRLLAEPLGVEMGVRPVALPLHASSTYEFESMHEAEAFNETPDVGYTYTRWGNPTVRATEQAVARVEGSEACALFGSGMAAIATTLLALVESGDTILAPHNLYGGTHHLLADLLPRYGIRTRFVAASELAESTAEAAREGTATLVYFEPVTNPTLRVLDVAAIVGAAHSNPQRPLRVVVDNTIATPLNLRPLDLGVDVVVHSATKYLAGHSDLLAGAVNGSAPLVERVRRTGRLLGGGLNPREAWLLHRGLKTLGVRVARQATSAAALARWLVERPEVVRVWYPGLPGHPEHPLAQRLLRLGVGLVSLEMATPAAARGLLDGLTLWRRAVSLGGVESLACISVLSSHHGVSAESLAHAGVTESTIRLSVGLEEVADLCADLAQALEALGGRGARPAERG
jgi:cystathionine beta-lyase/cystathionine gamma-synthase